jgi:Ca2+-transporting ATPase
MIDHLPEKAFAETVEGVLSRLETSIEGGLSQMEAAKRLEAFGENCLKRQRSKPVVLIFLEQFLDPVIYVLVAATVLGFAFGEIVEGVAVVIVILLTVFIGFFMEWQALRSMEALREMTRGESYVLRDGEVMLVEDTCIVPGDILSLSSGEFIPADGRVVEHESLAVKESALTGESFQVNKRTDPLPETTMLADRENMVFNGTMVTRGTAKVVVTATGEQTELGKISTMTREAKDQQTPIEKKLNVLSKKLIWLTLFLAIAIGFVGYIQGRALVQMIETAFALAVAAIPEGLPIVATIALARGMLRLAKDRAIIKQLSSVETLGNVGVICTDKTGTLTENKMEVQVVTMDGETMEAAEDSEDSHWKQFSQNHSFRLLIETGVLCNNVKLTSQNKALVGDPVEVALMELALDAEIDVKGLRRDYHEVLEVPFDTTVKMMATLNVEGEAYRISAKGALEKILDVCDHIHTRKGVVRFFDKSYWLDKANDLAAEGLRTLAFAYRPVEMQPVEGQYFEKLIFWGS